MKIDKLSLPHPVLGLGDDVSGAYQVSSSVKLGKERITVIVNHGLANATIEKLMENDVVRFCTEINCPQTLFREKHTSYIRRGAIGHGTHGKNVRLSESRYRA